MVIAISDLVVDKSYADGEKLSEAILDAALKVGDPDSIEDYLNKYVKDNLLQLAKDVMPGAYTFDNDGAGNNVNSIFNKQSVTDFYNGGNIDIGVAVDGAWIAVDAVNAAITITPEYVGKYRAVFYFTHRATSTATTLMDVDVGFRLTDGTDASYAVNSGGRVAATGAGSGVVINPVYLTCQFDWGTTTAKTVTLQKYVRTATDVNANVVAAAAASGEIYMLIEKI